MLKLLINSIWKDKLFQTLISIAFIFGIIVQGRAGTILGLLFLLFGLIWLFYASISGVELPDTLKFILDIYLDVEFVGLLLWASIHFHSSRILPLILTCLLLATGMVIMKRIK